MNQTGVSGVLLKISCDMKQLSVSVPLLSHFTVSFIGTWNHNEVKYRNMDVVVH